VLYNGINDKLTDIQTGLDGKITSATSAAFAGMTINGVEHKEKEPAAKALLEACKGVTAKKNAEIHNYMAFNLSLRFDSFHKTFSVLLRGNMTYQTDLGTDAFGNITRINNALNDLPKRLDGAQSQLDTLLSQQEAAKLELQNPFMLADELAEKEARLALLNAELNIDGSGGLDVMNDIDTRSDNAGEIEPDDGAEYEEEYERQPASAKSAKPPMLETLRSYSAEKQPSIPGRKTSEPII